MVKKEWHAPNNAKGMGDFYGQGIKNPIGKVRSSYMDISKPISKMKKPKTLA